MYPAPFTYHRATTVDEAISLLGEHADTGKLLAGGHSLLPVMKLRLAEPEHVIDITSISELKGISIDGDTITIGALVTHGQLASDDSIAKSVPLLREMANVVGDRQVRNRGTIGGTLAHADPAADYPAGMLALNATIVAQGPNGEREIAIDDFFTGFLETALGSDELITCVRIPVHSEDMKSAYEKLANPASGYASVGVAVVATGSADGTLSNVRVGITGSSDHAWRATGVEDALEGSSGDASAVRNAAAKATDGVEMLEDKHAPADYRAKVTVNLTRRALMRLL